MFFDWFTEVTRVVGSSYFWEFCSRLAAFWGVGFSLARFSHPCVSYSTQSVPWLWPSRKWCVFSLLSTTVWPTVKCINWYLAECKCMSIVCLCMYMCVTCALSLCRAVVTEESLQECFFWPSRLQNLLLHQPKQTSGLICPGQSTYLKHRHEYPWSNNHSSFFSTPTSPWDLALLFWYL